LRVTAALCRDAATRFTAAATHWEIEIVFMVLVSYSWVMGRRRWRRRNRSVPASSIQSFREPENERCVARQRRGIVRRQSGLDSRCDRDQLVRCAIAIAEPL
jgi:hypothetical protein